MKSTVRHIAAIALLALALAAPACGNRPDEEPQPLSGASAGQPVGLRISVGDIDPTRSFPGATGEEAGSAAENHIDIAHGDFRILFFAMDNTFLSQFEPQSVELGPITANEKLYEMRGELAEPLPADFKIVVLANWGTDNYPENPAAGETEIGDICTAVYDYAAWFEPAEDRGIPMYGVKTCTGMSFTPDLLAHLGTIDLLRALAKVEIVCEDGTTEITGLTVNCVNSAGYCAPAGMYDRTANVSSLHIPAEASADSFSRTFGEGASAAAFYIPEYKNSGGASVRLTFRTEDSGTREGTIYFKNYSTDIPFDIVRNYLYRYTVRFGTSLEIRYTLCPWGLYEADIPEFE